MFIVYYMHFLLHLYCFLSALTSLFIKKILEEFKIDSQTERPLIFNKQ